MRRRVAISPTDVSKVKARRTTQKMLAVRWVRRYWAHLDEIEKQRQGLISAFFRRARVSCTLAVAAPRLRISLSAKELEKVGAEGGI